MKAKLAKLIDVKSIMTLALTLVFCVLALCGVISGEQFLTIFVTVVGFYFGTQAQKKAAAAATEGSAEPSGTVIEQADGATEAVDEAMAQEIHPPDAESAEKDIVVSGFAG